MNFVLRSTNRFTALLLLLTLLTTGCAVQQTRSYAPFRPKPDQPPAIHFCFDTVGHIAGTKPYILGGTCVCTPTEALLKDYQAHGYFVGMSFDELLQRYRDLGVQTARDHQGCNNMCVWGPHLVKGGHCMVPPTPGTTNYEEVLSGRFVPQAPIKKEKSK